jgi:hypothetical protein
MVLFTLGRADDDSRHEAILHILPASAVLSQAKSIVTARMTFWYGPPFEAGA